MKNATIKKITAEMILAVEEQAKKSDNRDQYICEICGLEMGNLYSFIRRDIISHYTYKIVTAKKEHGKWYAYSKGKYVRFTLAEEVCKMWGLA